MNKLFQAKLNVKKMVLFNWKVKLNYNVVTVNCYVYNFSIVRLKTKTQIWYNKFLLLNFKASTYVLVTS